MNRRERTLSPVATRRSTRRLLPRIQYQQDQSQSQSQSQSSSSLWEFNDRSKKQSRRQCRQQEQRKRQQEEMKERLLDQLHSAGADVESPDDNDDEDDEDDVKSESSSTPSVVDLIEKFELLPDNHPNVGHGHNGESGNATDSDADSIFSSDNDDDDQSSTSVSATMLNKNNVNGTNPKKQQVHHQHHPSSTTSPQVRRKLQEAALSEAMSAPGHSLRQRNAMMASRSSRGCTTVAPANLADGFDRQHTTPTTNHLRSTSMPRTLPKQQQPELEPKSASTPLGDFLSSKQTARDGQRRRCSSTGIKITNEDNQSSISSVTMNMTVLKRQEHHRQEKTKEQQTKVPEEDQESVPSSHNSLDKEHRLDVNVTTTSASGSSDLVCYQPSDLVNAFNHCKSSDAHATMNGDGDGDECRQSPEHSSNESTPIKDTNQTGVVVAESPPPNAPSLLLCPQFLPTLDLDYSPLSLGAVGGSSNDNDSVDAEKTIKIGDAVSPDRTIRTEAETSSDEEELSSKDSVVDSVASSDCSIRKDDANGCSNDFSRGVHELANNKPKDLPQYGEIVKVDNVTSAIEYNIQNQGSKDLIECSIVQKVAAAADTATTASSIPTRETMNGIHPPIIAPRPSATITGKPSLFALAAAELAIERARQASGGANTPRTVLLEKQGWAHHHRYARHRSASSEVSPVIVPLNHVSSAVVLNSGGAVAGCGTAGTNELDRSARGRCMTSAPKVIESAKELIELHAWTAELSTLRVFKIDAERTLKEYEQELVSREAWEEEIKKEYEEDARANVELLKGQVSTLLHERDRHEASLAEQSVVIQKLEDSLRVAKSDAAEWKAAAEGAVTESSKEMAKLSQSNDGIIRENELLRVELESCSKHLKTTTDIAAQEASCKVTELSQSNDTMKREIERLRGELESCSKKLKTTDIAAKETSSRSDKLEEKLTESQSAESIRAAAAEESRELNLCLTTKLRQLQDQIMTQDKTQKESCRQLQESLRVTKDQVVKLKERVGVMTKDSAKLQAELDEANITKELTRSELNDLKARQEAEEIKRAEDEGKELSEVQLLQEKFSSQGALMEATTDKYEASIHIKDGEIDKLNTQVEALSNDACELGSKLVQATSTTESKCIELEALHEQLAATVSSSQECLSAKQDEMDQLKDQVDTLQADLNAAMAVTEARSVEEYNSVQVEAMNRKLQAKEEKIVKLKSRATSLNLQAKELSMSLVELCDWKSKAEAIMKKDAESNAELEKELSVLRSQANEAKASLMIAIDEKGRAERALDEKHREMEVLEVHHKDGCVKALEIGNLHSEHALISVNLSTAQEQLELSKRDIAHAEAKRDEAVAKSTILQSSLVKLQAENDHLSADLKESESKCIKLGTQMEEAMARYNANEMDHQEQISILVQGRDDLATKFEECSSDVARMGERLSTVESDRDGALLEAEQHRLALSNKEEELLSLRTENVEATSNISRLNIEVTKKVVNLQEELDAVTLTKETVSSELAVLEKNVDDCSDESHGLIQAKSEKLADLQERLEAEQSSSSELRQCLQAAIQAKEREVVQLKIDLKRACSDAEMVKANLELESRDLKKWRVANESLLETKDTELQSLREKLQAEQESSEQLKNTIQMKETEIKDRKSQYEKALADAAVVQAELSADVEFLELELQENNDMHSKALMEERGPRHDATRRLETALSARKKELVRVKRGLQEAESASRKMQTEVDSLNIVIESSQVDKEKSSAEIMDLQEQLKNVTGDFALKSDEVAELTADGWRLEQELQTKSDSLNTVIKSSLVDKENAAVEITDLKEQLKSGLDDFDLKSGEVVALSASVDRLEQELQENKNAHREALLEERGPRLEETRRLQTSLCDREKEVGQLKLDLRDAIMATRKLQTQIDSLNLVNETSHFEEGKALAEVAELNEQLLAASETIAEKSGEISRLLADIECLEQKMSDQGRSSAEKLVKERGIRLNESRTISARDKEVNLLKHDLKEAAVAARKMQSEIGSLNQLVEPKDAEITALREKVRYADKSIGELTSDADKAMEEQGSLLETVSTLQSQCQKNEEEIIDRETDISFLTAECEEQSSLVSKLQLDMNMLEKKLDAAEQVAAAQFREDKMELMKQIDLLQLDATSKLDVISDLITKNNALLEEINELNAWKAVSEQETMASKILAQRVVDLENELEHQRTKYQNAVGALAGMEEALLTVEKQRKKHLSKNEEDLFCELGSIEENSV